MHAQEVKEAEEAPPTDYPPSLGRPASLTAALTKLLIASDWGKKPRTLGQITTAACMHTNQKLTPKIVKQIMTKIKKTTISPLMGLACMPMYLYFEFFSIGGKSAYLRETLYSSIIKPWNDEGITIIVPKEPFKDFRAFTTVPHFSP